MGVNNPFIRLANDLLDRPTLGRGLRSPLWRDPATGGFQSLSGPEAVKARILDLIDTAVGERVMKEDFGAQAAGSLFESQVSVIDVMPIRFREAIVRFEPAVTRVAASGRPLDETTVIIDVSWYLRATGQPDGLVYPYYLEGSNV